MLRWLSELCVLAPPAWRLSERASLQLLVAQVPFRSLLANLSRMIYRPFCLLVWPDDQRLWAHLELGRKLTDGCIWTYEAMPLGIMPEVFDMLPCEKDSPCVWDAARWHSAVLKGASKLNANIDASAVIERERLPLGFTSISDRR